MYRDSFIASTASKMFSYSNLLWLQSNDIDKLSAKWRKKGKGVQLKDSEKFTMNSLVGILQFEITKKTGRYWHEIKPNQEIKPIFPENLDGALQYAMKSAVGLDD